jgi:AcrR family transcriptional regulator
MASTIAAPPDKVARTSARDRLLAAADELFYREGINNVGIDRVIEHAGVAKASLYSNFGSKDELVRAYLERKHEARKELVLDRLARHRSPREKLLSVFDGIAARFAMPDYRGCAFVRATSEMPVDGPAKEVSDTARGWLRELFTQLAREAGARNAPALAQQLVLLYDGAVTAAQMDGNVEAATTARSLAAQLVAAAPASSRSRG